MAGDFVGRVDELKKLDDFLNGPCRYITIHGFGGIGKTALAIQAANNFTSGSVLGLSLAGIPKLSQVVTKLASSFHTDVKDFPDLNDQLLEILQALKSDNQILLYLDNMQDIKHATSGVNLTNKKNAKSLMKFFTLL